MRKLLDRLVLALSRRRQFEMSLEEVEKQDARLAGELAANNHRKLHCLRELGLITLQRTEDENGRPNNSVSLSHDSIFESLLLAGRLRYEIKSWLTFTGGVLVISAVMCALFWIAGESVLRSTVRDREASAVAFFAINGAAVPSQEEAAKRQQLQAASLALIAATADAGKNFINAFVTFAFANACAFAIIVLSMAFLKAPFVYFGLQGDPRIRYLSLVVGLQFNRQHSKLMAFYVVPCLIWTFGCALYFEFSADSLIVSGVPSVVFLSVILFASLILVPMAYLKCLRDLGSQLLIEWEYSKKGVSRYAASCGRIFLIMALTLTVMHILVSSFPHKIGFARNGVRSSAQHLAELADPWKTLAMDIETVMGKSPGAVDTAMLKRGPVYLDRPLFDSKDSRVFFYAIAAVMVFTLIGLSSGVFYKAMLSRRLFPEQWRKGVQP